LGLKIVHINEYYSYYGGAESYLLAICKSLEEMGHKIIIISSSEKEHTHVSGRREYFLSGSYGLRSSFRVKGSFKEILERENPDIIHLHNTQYFISPWTLKYFLSIKPVVITVHDVRLFCPSFRWKVIPSLDTLCDYPLGLNCFRNGCYPFLSETRSFLWNLHKFLLGVHNLKISRAINRIMVPSSYMAEQLVINGFPRERIMVIPHFTEEVTNNETGTATGGSESIILYVGKLAANKGIMQFIEALSLLKDKDWRAEIIGEGEMYGDAFALADRLGVNTRINFTGNLTRKKLNDHYIRCHSVVIPSMVPESFGLAGIEAMKFGKPIIAFDSGGIKEWLVNNENGFIVKRGDVKALASSISRLLEDRCLAEKMGENGKKRVKKHYRKDLHLKKLLAVYEEAIRGGLKAQNHTFVQNGYLNRIIERDKH